MAVNSSLGSWFESLKKLENEDPPWLPSRPWESIPSESGLSPSENTPHSSLSTLLYHTSTISEASLVRLAMNSLQGVESALISLEKFCAVFCSDTADRTFHRIQNLWNRSLSTIALRKILKSIGHSGCIVSILLKFVDYFTTTNLDGNSKGNKSSESGGTQNDRDREGGENPPYSLVNQAFAVAVRKVLEGYTSALDTLYASVSLRRLSESGNLSSSASFGAGFLTSLAHSEVTLLEVYLHTKGLRTLIDALGNICNVHDIVLCSSSFENLGKKLMFNEFPIGGNLLTYLYTQLKVSDPVHCALLKFLFLRSVEPYCEFIRSWIYKAKINDPHNEFIVDYINYPLPNSVGNSGISSDFPSATIRVQERVAIPCFLKDCLIPLCRAGQQLQVLMKLLELSDNVGDWNNTYEDFLPYWRGLSDDFLSHTFLTFNKVGIERTVLARNKYYKQMMDKLESLSMKIDFRYQQVVSHATESSFINISGRSPKIPARFSSDDTSLVSPSTYRTYQHLDACAVDSEASSMFDDLSSVEDPLESSECSTLYGPEKQNQAELQIELPHTVVDIEQIYLSALSFTSSISIKNSLPNPSKSEMPNAVESDSFEKYGLKDPAAYILQSRFDGLNLNNNCLLLDLDVSNLSQTSELQDQEKRHDIGWPLGGVVNNPLYVGRGKMDESCLLMFGCGLEGNSREVAVLKEGTSHCINLIPSNIDLIDEAATKDQHPGGIDASYNSISSKSWKAKYDSNFLNMNPILTRNSFVQRPYMPGDRHHSLPSFDFTSIRDPVKVSVENSSASPSHHFGARLSVLTDSAASASFAMSDFHEKEGDDGDKVSFDKAKSSTNSRENVFSENVFGGSGWQNILGSYGNSDDATSKDHNTILAGIIEIPLDFVIQKCLLEEIQLQYCYVSKLTIKVLEEGFNLHEHLMALRRYHFMELADWADLFIMSLWHHKWYVTDADRRISDIQGFLNFSIQRSSCEIDNYKNRIYVYMKGQQMMPPVSSTGIHSFNYLGLGYRVDWPISIILTPSALEIYAEIFSFLMQVKLALSSVTEVWRSLKGLLPIVNQNGRSEFHGPEIRHLAILMRLRQQVSHFVTTLQQYVHSQLSHVSWCKFLHSLKYKVKDMMDLGSVHMAYLTDSLHICFLSNETQAIACIVQSILQCALDFRSCVIESNWEAGIHAGDTLSKLSRINISQVFAIKGIFDKNIKELYVCYLKSPRHGDCLTRFWDYLNYNEYYSQVVGKDIGHHAFIV